MTDQTAAPALTQIQTEILQSLSTEPGEEFSVEDIASRVPSGSRKWSYGELRRELPPLIDRGLILKTRGDRKTGGGTQRYALSPTMVIALRNIQGRKP